MHLLQGSPTAVTEFCSLSLVLTPSPNVELASAMGEPLLLASPSASISTSSTLNAVKELHAYVAAAIKASNPDGGKLSAADRLAIDWLREDEKSLEDMQVFRPSSAAGLALHFRLVRETAQMAALSQHILSSNRGKVAAAAATTMAPPAGLVAVLFVVGFSGLPYAHASSPIQYSMPQRMNDCIALLVRIPTKDIPVVKTTLATFLLNDDEHRKTNEMAATPNLFMFPESDDLAEGMRGVLSSTMGIINPGLRQARRASVTASRNAAAEGPGEGNDHRGPHMGINGVELTINGNAAEMAREITEQLNVLSVSETDTCLRKYAQTGQERKANLDLTGGGKSRFRRRKAENDADFDNFDYKGPIKIAKKKFSPGDHSKGGGDVSGSALQLRQPKKDTRAKAAVPALSASRADASSRRFSNLDTSSVVSNGFDPFNPNSHRQQPRRRSQGPVFDDESSLISDNRSAAQDSVGSQARVQVNIALNEDLACSYKHSQMSSCSVEGVVQVCVRLEIAF